MTEHTLAEGLGFHLWHLHLERIFAGTDEEGSFPAAQANSVTVKVASYAYCSGELDSIFILDHKCE